MADRGDEQVRYKVAAPYVTLPVRDDRGQTVISGFYAGASVPPAADEAVVQRLLEKDMLVRVDDPIADIVAVPAGTPIPGEPPNVPVEEVPRTSHEERMARARDLVGSGARGAGRQQRRSDDPPERGATADSPDAVQPSPPAVTESKATWVDYAVTQGEDRGKAEAMSKEQLVGRFGKR